MAIEVLRDPRLAPLDYNRNSLGKDFTPPAPKHYSHAIFLWDTGFIAWRYAAGGDPATARSELETLLSTQDSATGFIPNMTFLGKGRKTDLERLLVFGLGAKSSDYTQPPVIAMTALKIHEAFCGQERFGEAQEFLTSNYDSMASYYKYFINRAQTQPSKSSLIELRDGSESGRDADIIFDKYKKRIPYEIVPRTLDKPARIINGILDYGSSLAIGRQRKAGKSKFAVADVMFNCIYAENLSDMAQIAKITGHEDESVGFAEASTKAQDEIIESMWDEEDKAFYAAGNGEPIKKVSIGSLFPLILGDIRADQVDALLHMIESPDWFNTPYPLPSVPTNDPSYDPGYREPRIWRGPVWINMNWYIVRGLQRQAERFKEMDSKLYQRSKEAALRIGSKSKELTQKSGYREFYHPHTGQGFRVKDFAWSTLADTL